MAVIIKNLASGTLTNTTAKVTGPATGKAWLVKSVILTNRDTVPRAVDAKVTGTSPSTVAYIAPPSMAMAHARHRGGPSHSSRLRRERER